MDRREDHRQTARVRRHARAGSAATSAVWPVACWVFVLAAIGVVQVVRMQWFDAVVFCVAAGGVALQSLRGVPRRPTRRLALPWLAGAAAVIGAVLCFLPRHGPMMQAMVIAVGVIAIVLVAPSGAAVARPDAPTALTPGIRRLALAWTVIVVAGCIWELIQFILGLVQPDATWFALSDLLNPAVATVPGKILFIAVWLAGGVWLLRRGGKR
jgi:hypothetical protein